jgi:tryptophan synthase alpha chain
VSRIGNRFEALSAEGGKALVTYVVAGDPAAHLTVPLLHELVAAGADILELGVPFSDPMSEGPVIQLGHERALANGVSLSRTLEMVREFRQKDDSTPLLLMGYANPVEHMGYVSFASAAKEAGVDGLLTVDLPPEEVGDLNTELRQHGLDNIFLVAPTTPTERIATIVDEASGFLYCISLKGVTGAGHLEIDSVSALVQKIRDKSDLPVAVGFGIRDADSARAVATVADGVVVGSALVDAVAKSQHSGEDEASMCKAAGAVVREIRQGIDSISS